MKSITLHTKDNIEIQNKLISKIKDFIIFKNLEPGEKLPSERILSEKFNVSRRCLKEAIEKLEYYGLLESVPQSGTFVANIGQIALNGIIEDIVALKRQDFISLVETRLMLEIKSVAYAAKRRTKKDLNNIESAFNKYKAKIISKESALQEDLLFHLAIAKASGNSTINALMLQISPKIISFFKEAKVCDEEGFILEINKHEAIFQAIKSQDAELAVKAIESHFERLINFCDEFRIRKKNG